MTATLVTGASGFVGLNLLQALLAAGRTVVALDPRSPPPDAARAFSRLPGRLVHVPGDVTREADWTAALAAAGPAPRIAHLAAITAGAEREKRDARRILDVNLGSALLAIEAAARSTSPRLLLLSSAAIYGPDPAPAETLDEAEARPMPATLYAVTKLAVEGAGLRLAALNDLSCVVVRLSAVWGPWEHETGLRDTLSPMHEVLSHWRERREAVLHPDAIARGRLDWIYATDAGEGLAALLDAPRPPNGVYNLGSGQAFGIETICRTLQVVDPSFRWRPAGPGETPSVPHRYPMIRPPFSIARINAATGWQPRFASSEHAVADWLAWARTGID